MIYGGLVVIVAYATNISPTPSMEDDFLLLDGTDFLLLDGGKFLLL